MSASAYPQGVCKHTSLSACQNVSKSECLKSVYHHVSVSACQVVRVSASQCQRTSMPTWLPASMSTCENVGMSGCERFISVNMSLSHCLSVLACLCPEDYNCIVATVLNVLHPLWSCILFSFCASFESSSKFWRGKIDSLVVFFKVQV